MSDAENAPAPEAAPAEKENKTLYIGQLRYETTSEILREGFEQFGQVVDARVCKRPDGKSKGFGFVDYEKLEDAMKAIEEMDGKEFDGRVIKVNLSQPTRDRESRDSRGYRDDRRGGYRDDRRGGYRDDRRGGYDDRRDRRGYDDRRGGYDDRRDRRGYDDRRDRY